MTCTYAGCPDPAIVTLDSYDLCYLHALAHADESAEPVHDRLPRSFTARRSLRLAYSRNIA